MGELVLFRPRAAPRRRAGAEASSAEILFFTGVRIMRVVEPPKTRGRRRPPRGDALNKRRDRTI
jgi:hypothetical protein